MDKSWITRWYDLVDIVCREGYNHDSKEPVFIHAALAGAVSFLFYDHVLRFTNRYFMFIIVVVTGNDMLKIRK